MTCPRCRASQKHLRKEQEGLENGKLIWTVFHCKKCSYTWRDTELPEILTYDKRDHRFSVDAENPEQYPYIYPPAKIVSN